MSDFDPISGQKYLTYSAGALNAAIAAERERCAKIAEAYYPSDREWTLGDVREELAEKIRSGK